MSQCLFFPKLWNNKEPLLFFSNMHISGSLCIKSRGCSYIIEQFLSSFSKDKKTLVNIRRESTEHMGRVRKSHKKAIRRFKTTQKDNSKLENEDLHIRPGQSVSKTLGEEEKIKSGQGLQDIGMGPFCFRVVNLYGIVHW